jgi:hypothetical protein
LRCGVVVVDAEEEEEEDPSTTGRGVQHPTLLLSSSSPICLYVCMYETNNQTPPLKSSAKLILFCFSLIFLDLGLLCF